MEKSNLKISKLGENYYKETIYYGNNADGKFRKMVEVYYKLIDTNNPNIEFISVKENGDLLLHDYIGIKHHELDNKPAVIEYFPGGSVKMEEYCTNGHYHRDADEPSTIDYVNGRVTLVYYYKNGKCHRFGKPAYTEFGYSGDIKYKGYWEYGRRVTEEESIRKYKIHNRKNILKDIKDGKN